MGTRREDKDAKKEDKDAKKKGGGRADSRVWVRDGKGRRPFMRGIMVHSLMARGVSFDDAYAAADSVGAALKGRGTVDPSELTRLASEMLGPDQELDTLVPPPLPVPIEVIGHRETRPFSKGSLSQSLLAAALHPNDAFDVAREIEFELVGRSVASVDRSELRELAYKTLHERFGRKTANRYLRWREHQHPQKPVIILIGGTTGVGKTSIALEVALRLGIRRVLSTDSVRQVMRIMLSKDLAPALHTSSFDAHENMQSATEGDDAIIEGFLAQTQAVSVGVRAMIDRAIEEGTSLVVDGVSIVPGMLDTGRYHDDAHVVFLMIARLDRDAFETHFTRRGNQQQRRGGQRYLDNLDGICLIQDHLLDVADRFDVPIIDNVSVDASVLLAIRHIVEALRGEHPNDRPHKEASDKKASAP